MHISHYRGLFSPITDRLKCAKNEASLAAIMVQREGLPDWWRIGREFPTIFRKSRTDRWELTGIPSPPLIANTDTPLSEFPIPITDRLKCAMEEASLFALRAQKEGLPDWWRIGRDFRMSFRRSMTARWELTAPSFWTLIADGDSLLSAVLTDWFSRWLSVRASGQSAQVRAPQMAN